MTPGPGIKPGTHWWKASPLTTTPTLLSQATTLAISQRALYQSKLDVTYQTPKTVFDHISKLNIEKSSGVFLKNFEVFGDVIKLCFECLIYFLSQLRRKKKN